MSQSISVWLLQLPLGNLKGSSLNAKILACWDYEGNRTGYLTNSEIQALTTFIHLSGGKRQLIGECFKGGNPCLPFIRVTSPPHLDLNSKEKLTPCPSPGSPW